MSLQDDLVLPPDQGRMVWIAGLGVRFIIGGDQTGGRFSVVEHPLKPGALGAPLHTHSREDEFSFILEGELGVQIGDREFVATPGMLVFKPRAIPHTFWNKGPQLARLLELICPAGFERYFAEVAEVMAKQPPDFAALPTIADKYGLTLDLGSIATLRTRHGLR
jgi:mannose-6-phosphate isomerase-like protein (cupin superfamily)